MIAAAVVACGLAAACPVSRGAPAAEEMAALGLEAGGEWAAEPSGREPRRGWNDGDEDTAGERRIRAKAAVLHAAGAQALGLDT